MDVARDALRADERAVEVARSLTVSTDGTAIDERLIEPLAFAPLAHVSAFKRRRGRILFGDSYLSAAGSDYANERRGFPLTAADRVRYQQFDCPDRPVHGLYDPRLDALVFSSAAQPQDHERVVLHEFGHAMTYLEWYNIAHTRSDLLTGLPPDIDHLLRGYAQGHRTQDIRERVLEVLAEGYLWALVGRVAELPVRLLVIVQDVMTRGTLRATG